MHTLHTYIYFVRRYSVIVLSGPIVSRVRFFLTNLYPNLSKAIQYSRLILLPHFYDIEIIRCHSYFSSLNPSINSIYFYSINALINSLQDG